MSNAPETKPPGTLIITRGLPASGKSTLAKAWVAESPATRARINRDDLRAMLHDGKWLGPATENQIVKVQRTSIIALLQSGIDVCCDDTNLKQDIATALAQIGTDFGSGFDVIDLTDVPLDECIRRDALRAKPLGAEVIQGMHDKFLSNGPLANLEGPK